MVDLSASVSIAIEPMAAECFSLWSLDCYQKDPSGIFGLIWVSKAVEGWMK